MPIANRTTAKKVIEKKAVDNKAATKKAAKKTAGQQKTNKTQQTALSVETFLAGLASPQQREDAQALMSIMSSISGLPPAMWGTSIIGFGTHHYVYESGREGDTPIIAFSPRKTSLVLYLKMYREQDTFDWATLFASLGKHKQGKGCLYIRTLADVDINILHKIIAQSYDDIRAKEKK